VALLDSRRQDFRPLVTWDAKWASHHTVPATHATLLRIHDGPRRGLPESPHGANGNTGRILTVHAEAADVHASVSLDHVECVGGELFITALIHREVGIRAERSECVSGQEVARAAFEQAVYKLARNNATLAANTTSRINENCLAHFS